MTLVPAEAERNIKNAVELQGSCSIAAAALERIKGSNYIQPNLRQDKRVQEKK